MGQTKSDGNHAGELVGLLLALQQEYLDARMRACERDSQENRRTLVRVLCALIEGVNWGLKLQLASNQMLDEGERACVREQAYDLKDNGAVRVRPLHLKTVPNTRFTFTMFARIHKIENPLPGESATWKALRDVVDVRNRITHPKKASDLTITEEELQAANAVFRWYSESFSKLLKDVTARAGASHD